MKKAYSKPEILFENFTMSTNIAAGCEGPKVGPTKDSCAVYGTGGIAIFTSAMDKCDFTPTEMGGVNDDIWDGFCYHVPVDTANLFNS